MPEPVLCGCGCGQPTSLAAVTRKARGHVAGLPVPFVLGHKTPKDKFAYTVEDRGFETPCHIWAGSTDTGTGYGRVFVGGRHVIASRFVYEQEYGPLPPWQKAPVDHRCRVPACVRLDHLQAVTTAENIRRGVSAVVSAAQVAEIRSLCERGWVQRDIAAAYGISPQQVTKIKLGQRWSAEGGLIHAAA